MDTDPLKINQSVCDTILLKMKIIQKKIQRKLWFCEGILCVIWLFIILSNLGSQRKRVISETLVYVEPNLTIVCAIVCYVLVRLASCEWVHQKWYFHLVTWHNTWNVLCPSFSRFGLVCMLMWQSTNTFEFASCYLRLPHKIWIIIKSLLIG